MKKPLAFSLPMLALACFLSMPRANSAATDESEIRQLQDRWAKAFHAKDLEGIMAIYQPGESLVAYDVVPPLEYTGFEAYKKDYREFLDQFQGPIDVEFRDVSVVAGNRVAYSNGLERISGRLVKGRKFDAWLRFTECYRKINGRWLAVHDHISVPVDLDSGKAELDLKP